MEWLRTQGFEVVEYRVVTSENLDEAMDYFAEEDRNTMIFRRMGLWHYMMTLLMESRLEAQRSFREMRLLLNGQDEVRETTLAGDRMESVKDRADQSDRSF